MREVLQQVLATEAEARRMVQSAGAEAERILTEARRQAHALTVAARDEAQREAREILSAAAVRAGQEKQVRLARAATGLETQVRLAETDRQAAIAAVVRCVCAFK
jgi:vacuolar-type H+-ATPase subunit H